MRAVARPFVWLFAGLLSALLPAFALARKEPRPVLYSVKNGVTYVGSVPLTRWSITNPGGREVFLESTFTRNEQTIKVPLRRSVQAGAFLLKRQQGLEQKLVHDFNNLETRVSPYMTPGEFSFKTIVGKADKTELDIHERFKQTLTGVLREPG